MLTAIVTNGKCFDYQADVPTPRSAIPSTCNYPEERKQNVRRSPRSDLGQALCFEPLRRHPD